MTHDEALVAVLCIAAVTTVLVVIVVCTALVVMESLRLQAKVQLADASADEDGDGQ